LRVYLLSVSAEVMLKTLFGGFAGFFGIPSPELHHQKSYPYNLHVPLGWWVDKNALGVSKMIGSAGEMSEVCGDSDIFPSCDRGLCRIANFAR
jgi:hypothetical protein